MSAIQIPIVTSVEQGDTAATANSIPIRDSVGDIYANVQRGSAGVRSGGHLYAGYLAITGGQTIDEATYNGTTYGVSASGGVATITLPAASLSTNKIVIVEKTDSSANRVAIDGNSTETVGGALILALYRQYDRAIIQCDGSNWIVLGEPRLLFDSVAASSAISGTATETAFDKSITIAANTLKDGDVLRVRGHVTNSAANASDTLTLKLKIGASIAAGVGTTIVATAAVDLTDGGGDIGYFDATITLRTSGASGTLTATGVQALGVPGTVTAKPFLKASTAIDTTAAQILGVSGTWSSTSGTNSATLETFVVEKVSAL